MKKWENTLRAGRALRRAINNGDYEGIITGIKRCYQEMLDKDIIDDEDYYDWTEELNLIQEDLSDGVTEDIEERLDFELNNLYDACDNLNCWISLEESVRKPIKEEAKKITRYSDVLPQKDRDRGWWYFTTHGVGPGTIPKDLNVLEIRDGQNNKGTWGTFVRLDGIVNTSELSYYDLTELVPPSAKNESLITKGNRKKHNKKLTEARKQLQRFTFEDGLELTAYSAEEAMEKAEKIEKNRHQGKARPFKDIDNIAKNLYKKEDDFSFHYFSDDELVQLWCNAILNDAPYDDEVFEAISDMPNSKNIFDRAKKLALQMKKTK